MAVQCYCVRFAQSDHQFLHESHVFSNISRILSKSEEENDDSSIDSSLVSVCACVCECVCVRERVWVSVCVVLCWCVLGVLFCSFVFSWVWFEHTSVCGCPFVMCYCHLFLLGHSLFLYFKTSMNCALNVLVPSLLSVVMGLFHLLHGFCECLGFWLITSLLLLMLGNVFEFSGKGIKDKNHSVHVGALVLV